MGHIGAGPLPVMTDAMSISSHQSAATPWVPIPFLCFRPTLCSPLYGCLKATNASSLLQESHSFYEHIHFSVCHCQEKSKSDSCVVFAALFSKCQTTIGVNITRWCSSQREAAWPKEGCGLLASWAVSEGGTSMIAVHLRYFVGHIYIHDNSRWHIFFICGSLKAHNRVGRRT